MTRPRPHPPVCPSGVVHTLHPGDVVCGERGDRLETLLGSCVAVLLGDRPGTIGVMCHIVHSAPTGREADKLTVAADAAFAAMYRLLRGRGLNPRLCEAFVYGGGNMFPEVFRQAHVGEQNVRRVLGRLAGEGIAVRAYDLGGECYRRLRWTVGEPWPQVETVPVVSG